MAKQYTNVSNAFAVPMNILTLKVKEKLLAQTV